MTSEETQLPRASGLLRCAEPVHCGQPSSHITLCSNSSVVLSHLVVLCVEAARPRVGFRDLEFNHVSIKFQM